MCPLLPHTVLSSVSPSLPHTVPLYFLPHSITFSHCLPSAGFSIEGPSQAKIECNDNGDGSADVRYYPHAKGEYALHILCDNEDIPGSPYIANILPNTDYYPERVSG